VLMQSSLLGAWKILTRKYLSSLKSSAEMDYSDLATYFGEATENAFYKFLWLQ
jgi:hypothetical protein